MKPFFKIDQSLLKSKKVKLSSYFRKISTQFDGKITQFHFLPDKTIKLRVKFDSDIDVKHQINELESEIARCYKFDKVTIEETKKMKPLNIALIETDNHLCNLLELLDKDGTLGEFEQELDTLSGKFDDLVCRLREELTLREERKGVKKN